MHPHTGMGGHLLTYLCDSRNVDKHSAANCGQTSTGSGAPEEEWKFRHTLIILDWFSANIDGKPDVFCYSNVYS